jgi:glycosyltransferase involved in cell wall biosynthesis
MKFSIVTPTLCRESLLSACRSVNSQTFTDYEHLVSVDLPSITPRQQEILDTVSHPQRKLFSCGTCHNNYGNTCRRAAIARASGSYVVFLDDDDRFVPDTLEILAKTVTRPWAVYPLLRGGRPYRGEQGFFANGMLCVSRALAQSVPYPEGAGYCEDSKWADDLYRAAGSPQRVETKPLYIFNTSGGIAPVVTQASRVQDAAVIAEADRMSATEYQRRMREDRSFMAALESALHRRKSGRTAQA